MVNRKILITALSASALLILAFSIRAQNRFRNQAAKQQQAAAQTAAAPAVQVAARKRWVDSVYNRLTQEERIGQLFMVAAYSGGKNYNADSIQQLIDRHQIGGLIFMQGGPARQALLTNQFQQSAQVPLLLSMDAEWGLGMRLDSVISFPRQMMLGATRDTVLMYQVGMAIAYQCKRLGVHIDFAPDVDVNNNAANPVINSRSFGENKVWVTRMAAAYMRGLQNNGVMASLKHFPGHGNTDVDSHKDLPVISGSMEQLQETELYPFRQLIQRGAQSVMVAHLEVPALETEAHIPTTLSRNTVTGLLKQQMGFKGLVFTDALNMQGVTKYFQPGEVDLRAFMAGNDVLLFSQNVPIAIERIKNALDSGVIPMQQLEASVKKILGAKYDHKLNRWKPVNPANITNDINQFTLPLRMRVSEAAATVPVDKNGILTSLAKPAPHIQYIGLNVSESVLQKKLQSELPGLETRWLSKNPTSAEIDAALKSLDGYETNIIAIHGTSFYPANNYGLSTGLIQLLNKAQTHPKTILVLMGNAYILQNFCDVRSALVLYEDDSTAQLAAASVLTGNTLPKGKLPVTVCPSLVAGGAEATNSLQPAIPYELKRVDKPKMDTIVAPDALMKLSAFMNRCVSDRVFPGCRVYASQNGKVIFDKSFGYFDYNRQTPVSANTIYDVASVTKVLATTLAVMKLYEEGSLQLDKRLRDYLPWTIGTDKANITVRNLLLHQAGLKSWIPFYKETLDTMSGALRTDLYHYTPSEGWNTRVANSLFIRNNYADTIWKRILTQPVEISGRYNYSDLDFYFLKEIVERITGTDLDVYVQKNFYTPMGLTEITYNPLKKFPLARIAPTENDQLFRHQLVQGYVHDQGAALLGGVAGHAGIFASAGDVAAVFEMLLNNGSYKGRRYFSEATVRMFTAYSSSVSRRGLGFDKPNNNRNDAGPTAERCSGYTFGHQGFTGTCAWADPATGIVFVFLSNRVCPSADNNLINKLSVRTEAQEYIYQALGIPQNKSRLDVYQSQMKAAK
jgi:beta-glucosidase-like glycosyl hydrolase/CubicO group peptidase (beta-lactamase class C family)